MVALETKKYTDIDIKEIGTEQLKDAPTLKGRETNQFKRHD